MLSTLDEIQRLLDQFGLYETRDELDYVLNIVKMQSGSQWPPDGALDTDYGVIQDIGNHVLAALQKEAPKRSLFVFARDRQAEVQESAYDPLGFFAIRNDSPLQLTHHGIYSLQEAAYCYSVGFSMAASMFLLRTMEDVFRCYHAQVRIEDNNKKHPTWNKILSDLKSSRVRPVCPDGIIQHSTYFQKKRNQIMHPDEHFDATDWDETKAQDLLIRCKDCIHQIQFDLIRRRIR